MNIKLEKVINAQTAKIKKISISIGDNVKKGDILFSFEALKGTTDITSPVDGKVSNIFFNVGDSVKINADLCTIEEQTNYEVCPKLINSLKTKIQTICINEKQQVKAGDILFTLEGKKTNIKVVASKDEIINKILVKVGDEVEHDDKLCEITLLEENKSSDFDVIILGAGPGGYYAAIYAKKFFDKVLVVDYDRPGGTCLNRGCIPTKTIINSAKHYGCLDKLASIGINVESFSVNMEKVIENKNCVVDTLASGIEALFVDHKIKHISGFASLIDNETIKIKNDQGELIYKTKNIILATGSVINNIPFPNMDSQNVLNSDEALDLVNLPKSITIVGGGVIGMEFAFIYNALGVEVNVIEYLNEIISTQDTEVIEEITSIAIKKGINILTNSRVDRFDDVNNLIKTTFTRNDEVQELITEKVLVATGRKPNINFNKEFNKIELLEKNKGVKVNEHFQTNFPNVYAIGDLNNIMQLAHVASHQAMVAVDHMRGVKRDFSLNLVPSVIFTDPEIATVGYTEKDLIKQNISYEVSKFDYSSNGKALSMGKTEGFVKLVKPLNQDYIIGGTIIGVDASCLVNVLTLAIKERISVSELAKMIYPHPTTGEVLSEAFMNFTCGAIHKHE